MISHCHDLKIDHFTKAYDLSKILSSSKTFKSIFGKKMKKIFGAILILLFLLACPSLKVSCKIKRKECHTSVLKSV